MTFGDQPVIEELSFDVRAGETFGLLGPGSGRPPPSGRCSASTSRPRHAVVGRGWRFDPAHDVRLGYLPEERGLYRKDVLDVMIYFGRLNRPQPRRCRRLVAGLLDGRPG
ncbi:MAG: hypothetical protein R2719_01740 [Micropruina sp.]